jgi:uncharacterized protein
VRAGWCFAQTVGLLTLFSVARGLALLGPPVMAAGLLTAALALIAWRAGGTRADVGIEPAGLPAGVRYGGAALGVILVVLLLADVVPAGRAFLHDSRADISGGRLRHQLGLSIVPFTAIPEELAFRGVLLGSAVRLWGARRASLVTSALFGLWHIQPTLHTLSGNLLLGSASARAGGQPLLAFGAVVVTVAAGLVFCWLRLRSRSLAAHR